MNKYPLGVKNVKFVNLDNKSRKGEYVYFVDTATGKSRYLKKMPGKPISDYLSFAGTKIKAKRYGINYKYNKPKKRRTFKSVLKKGLSTIIVRDFESQDTVNYKQLYMKLLRPLVKDMQILQILCSEDNIDKLKDRLDIQLVVHGTEGEYIGTFSKASGKTLITSKQDLQEIPNGTELKDHYPKTIERMKERGWSYEHFNNGTKNSVDLKITFRRG